VQQVSDLNLKSALRPHHVWKYGRHPIWLLRLGEEKKKEERKIEITGQKYNGLPYYIGRP